MINILLLLRNTESYDSKKKLERKRKSILFENNKKLNK